MISFSERVLHRSSTIIVRDISPDVNEGVLYHHFKGIAQIMSVRMDNVGRPQMHGVANFFTPEDAMKAVKMFNGMVFPRDAEEPLAVEPLNSASVRITNVPTSWTSHQLYSFAAMFGTVTSCALSTDKDGNSLGYGFVQFDSKLQFPK